MLEAHDLALAGRLGGISARLEPGKVTAICGPNGAGKSTLLACLAGLLTADSGTVTLDGKPLAAMKAADRARRIGFLPQTPELAWDVSVEVLVSLGRLPWKGSGGAEGQAAIDTALSEMDLQSLRGRPVSRLSGGERARALMARVLATRPAWLLADEPLANLDLAHAATLTGCLRQQAARATGVVLVLHDLASARFHADHVLVLDRGQIVSEGPPSDALGEEVIARIWGVSAKWLGEPGSLALSLG